MRQGLLIIPVATLMLRTPPQSFIDRFSLLVKPGDKLDLHGLRRRLEQAGYNAVEQVLELRRIRRPRLLAGSLSDGFERALSHRLLRKAKGKSYRLRSPAVGPTNKRRAT